MTDLSGLTDMGFTHEQAAEAMRLTNNDIGKAIAYLVEGVVEDSVEVSNRQDIPDLNSYTSTTNAPTTTYGSSDHVEYGTSHHEVVTEEASPVASFSDSPDSMVLPEVQPREDDEPAVMITPSLNKCSGLAAIYVVVLSQIDEFRNKVNRSTDNAFLSDLRDIVNEFTSGTENYVINNLKFPVSEDDGLNEYIQSICNTFDENFVNGFEDVSMKKLLKSRVAVHDDEDDVQDDVQEISVIEVESDNRGGDVHGTFSELFWGKDKENLGKIWYDDLASIITLYFPSDMGYWSTPLDLSEVIYPQLYGKEFTDKFIGMQEKYNEIIKARDEIAHRPMNLSVFEGKKITSFLQQAANHVKDSQAKKELGDLTAKLKQEKADLDKQLNDLEEKASELDISRIHNFTSDLVPYRLMTVAYGEGEYFYFDKKTGNWVYVNVQKDLDFTQDFTDFNMVKRLLHDRLRHSAIDFILIYCSEEKLFETVPQEDLIDLNVSSSSSSSSEGTSPSDPRTDSDTKSDQETVVGHDSNPSSSNVSVGTASGEDKEDKLVDI